MCKGSTTITNGIQIQVLPEFIPSDGIEENKYLFLYRIDIQNHSNENVKLLSRYWLIINGDGEKEEVAGDGVVGYNPILKPNDSFIYSSYCPLNTEWGTMEGYFTFMKDDNTLFDAKIDRFYLAV